MSFPIARSTPLSATELYLFDTMGFVRLPGFLSRETADACRAEVLRGPSHRFGGRRPDKERFDDLVGKSRDLYDLASSPAVRQCVEPLINQPYRLIESYAVRRERDSGFYLHNGHSEFVRYGEARVVQRNMSLTHTFHEGKLFCMFVKVLVYLSDIRTEPDGPFCYLQGSHKANLPWFPADESIGRPVVTKAQFPSLEHVMVEAGDVILLNEALLHGTLYKTSGGERLVMAFSYAPAFVCDWREIDRRATDLAIQGHY
jgi:hypothetical protein